MNLQSGMREGDNAAVTGIGHHHADAMHGANGRAQFVSFAIGEDQYGVDIMSVREIKGWSEINYLPNQPDYMRGVVNLRGVIVPIIDLRCRFGQGLTEATALHIVIIVQIDDRHVGLLADRVLDIVSINTSDVQPVPNMGRDAEAAFLSGLVSVEGGMIALVDLPNLLTTQAVMGAEELRKLGAESGLTPESRAN
jgi:purine-binding chemotaxis protein CheW